MPIKRQMSIREALAGRADHARQQTASQQAQRAQAGRPLLAQQQRAAKLTKGSARPGAAAAPSRRKRPAGCPVEDAPERATPPAQETVAVLPQSPPPAAAPPPSSADGQGKSERAAASVSEDGTPSKEHGNLTIATYNPMGGTTAETAILALTQRCPDVLVLPELKISSNHQRKNLYRRLLGRDFVLTYSLLPGGSLLANKGKGGRTKAGVLIAVAKKHTAHHSLSKPEVPAHLHGHLSHVRLNPPGSRPLDIIGVYMPSASDEQHIRGLAGEYIHQTVQRCTTTGSTLVLAGDWNATQRDADRSTRRSSPTDVEHRQLVADARLVPAGGHPTDPNQPNEPTYRQQVVSGDAVCSRIDEVFVCLPTLPDAAAWKPADWEVPAAGGNSDHEPLVVHLPCLQLGYEPPPRQAKLPFQGKKQFTLPMCREELLRFKSAFQSEVSVQRAMRQFEEAASAAASKLEDAHSQALSQSAEPAAYAAAFEREANKQGVPNDVVETLAGQLHELLNTALETARQHCTMHTTTNRHYLPRTASRRVRELDRLSCLLKVGRRELETAWTDGSHTQKALLAALRERMEAEVSRGTDHSASDEPRSTKRGSTLCSATPRDVDTALQELQGHLDATARARSASPPKDPRLVATAGAPNGELNTVLAGVEASLSALRQERRGILRTDQLKAWGKAVSAWQKKYARQPRWRHKDIAACNTGAPRGIEVLRDPTTGTLTAEPTELLRILREQRQKTAAAPTSEKTGSYTTAVPTQGERGYPWETPNATDRFTLCTKVAPGCQREDLLPRIKDFGLFEGIIKRAANKKAAGPDEVPNEMLKFLPTQLHHSMHHMFVTMWLTGATPSPWKHSHTIMLYKKGDPTNPANYRPIGLARTVYKLWTALLTAVMSDYAAQHAIISDSQHGFVKR